MPGVVALGNFGLQMQQPGEPDRDQLPAFQRAVTAAAGDGDMIMLEGGRLVLDGTLHLPSLGCIAGLSSRHTTIKLADGANVQLMVANGPAPNSTGARTGSVGNVVRDLQFDGNFNGNTYADKNLPLLDFLSGMERLEDIEMPKEVWGHPRNYVDPTRTVENIEIVNSPGAFMRVKGRGSSFHRNIHARYCRGAGFILASCDDSWSDIISSSTGGPGFDLAAGCSFNQLVNLKAYFCGRDPERFDGDGFTVSAGGVSNITMIACSAQDTWRNGMTLQGHKFCITGFKAESIGSLYDEFRYGPIDQSSVHATRAAVRLANLKDSMISLQVGDRRLTGGRSALPTCKWLADIRSNSTGNVIEAMYGRALAGNECAAEVRSNQAAALTRNRVIVFGQEAYNTFPAMAAAVQPA